MGDTGCVRSEAGSDTALTERLRGIVGHAGVRTDDAARALFAQDVYRAGVLPLAIVTPGSVEQLQATVRTLTQAGVALHPRGGGMSYTDAFLPASDRAVIVDTGALTRLVELNLEDLFVTVEAGMTWADLDAALAPHDVRTTFWGPMSGRIATVGGACSQGAVTFGSGRNGVSGQSVLGFDVVLADGRILRTGSSGQEGHSAFFRHAGPDLTGVFAADSGALGIKARVTLALEPRPGAGDGLSFVFADFAGLLTAVSTIARHGLATEIFGAETELVRMVAGPPNLRADFAAMKSVLDASRNPIAGLFQIARMAAAGRRAFTDGRYLVNVLAEGCDPHDLARGLTRIRRAVGEFGREVVNTVPTVTRAQPFPPPMVLGPGGRRLLPLHGIFPPSAVMRFHNALTDLRERLRPRLDSHGIMVPVVYATVGRNGFLYEPVIYWRGPWSELHRRTMPADVLATMEEGPDDRAARLLVDEIRGEIVELMYTHGAVHLQIGRAYPYLRGRDPAFADLLRRLKAELDPMHLMNPGALGL
jgi:D-lactate dehydrogenase (cytochrome)